MYVHNASVILKTPSDTIKALDVEVKQQTGMRFRRVNRFILLSIYGAFLCARGKGIDSATSVWLTTENGTVGDTEKGLDQLFNQRIYPKPYNFINTMTNTAAFYIAQILGLDSPNITMSCKEFAFERGLILARADLRRGAASGALVGGVDEAIYSENNLQSRFGDRLKDGSAWLHITGSGEDAQGEIKEVRYFTSKKSTHAWLESIDLPQHPVIAFGVRIGTEEQREWLDRLPNSHLFDYIELNGFFDSATAAGVGLFFKEYKNSVCLHINRDSHGHYMLVMVEVY